MVLKNLFARLQWRNRYREQTYGHGERGGEGEMYGESYMETYITICKIDSQWEFAIWLRELKQALCINLEGRNEEGDGREVQEGEDKCEGDLVVTSVTPLIARVDSADLAG